MVKLLKDILNQLLELNGHLRLFIELKEAEEKLSKKRKPVNKGA